MIKKSLDTVLLYWMIVLLLVRNWTTQNCFLKPPKSRVTILEVINPYFCKFCEAGKVKRITHVNYNFNFRNGLIPLCIFFTKMYLKNELVSLVNNPICCFISWIKNNANTKKWRFSCTEISWLYTVYTVRKFCWCRYCLALWDQMFDHFPQFD